MLVRSVIAAAVLALSLSSPVVAVCPPPKGVPNIHCENIDTLKGRQVAAEPTQIADVESFVRGSVRAIIYHELGHLLIEEYEIPVLGRTEDAADSYVAFASASWLDPREVVAPIDLWRVMAKFGPQDRPNIQWWDEHGTEEQRAYRFACLLAGAHPDQYGALFELMGVPEEAFPKCAQEAQRNIKSWHSALDHKTALLVPGRPAMKSKVIYESVGDFSEERSWLEDSHILDEFAQHIGRYRLSDTRTRMALQRKARESARHGLLCAIAPSAGVEDSAGCGLPSDNVPPGPGVDIRAKSCGVPNAFYLRQDSPESDLANLTPDVYQTIVVCYELVKFVRDIANAIFAEERPR